MFEPSAIVGDPSGFADWPRPFVFRATHLDGRTIPAGSEADIQIILRGALESPAGQASDQQASRLFQHKDTGQTSA